MSVDGAAPGPHLLLWPGLGTGEPLASLVAHLARRFRVAAHDPGLGRPAAVLAPAGTPRQRGWGDAPVAWWVAHPADVPTGPLPASVRLLVTWPPVEAAGSGGRGRGGLGDVPADVAVEVVPAPGVDGTVLRPVVPFLRERWRRRLGLPADLVVRVGVPGAPALDEQTAHDALFLCAAAVVGPGHVLDALALGTPVVCDEATAAAIGAVDGEHVRVASGDEAEAVAASLAADQRAAALLARGGHRLVQARHDVAASARRVAAALGLAPVGPAPIGRLAGRLEELGTPLHATIASRVAGAVTGLGESGPDLATRFLRW